MQLVTTSPRATGDRPQRSGSALMYSGLVTGSAVGMSAISARGGYFYAKQIRVPIAIRTLTVIVPSPTVVIWSTMTASPEINPVQTYVLVLLALSDHKG